MATLVKQFNIEANHSVPPVPQTDGWTSWQRILFRFSFLFLAQITLPLRLGWYERLLAVRSLRQVYSLSMRLGVTYTTIPGESGRWGIGSFASLGIAFVIAAVGAAIWTWFARKSPRTEYRALYYWLRLAVRYWVALNIMHYGYIKFLPMQMPYPSISNLHSLFGEHAPYRLYWQAVGIVTWYQIALGVMEVTAGSLLLFRSTTALGALLNLVILYNVAHGNFAYDGGVHLLSSEIALLSGFLLAQYIPDLWKLLIKREDVQPSYYRPVFKRKWQRYAFTGAKVLAWLLFIPGFVYETYHGFYYTNLSKEPRSPGLTASKGYYNVTEFRLNGKLLPYSPLDPVRWHDVVFEDYPTLVYKVNRPLPVRLENGSPAYRDLDKRYELSGFSGGKVYLHYDLDEANHVLYLQDKSLLNGPNNRGNNAAQSGAAGKRKRRDPVKLEWHYSQPSEGRIVLSGLDEKKNSLYVVLDRVAEKFPIQIESPVPGEAPRYDRLFARRYPVTGRSFDGTGAPATPDAGDNSQ